MELVLYLGLGYLSTVIASYVILQMTTAKLFKHAADRGYKVKSSKLESIITLDEDDGKRAYNLFIPGFNIINMITYAQAYKNGTLIDFVRQNGSWEKMTDEEINVYLERPSAFMAYCISSGNYKSVLKEETSMKDVVKCNSLLINDEEKIRFIIKHNDAYVVSSDGKIAQLCKGDQEDIVEDSLACLLEYAKQKGISSEEFNEMLQSNEADLRLGISIDMNKDNDSSESFSYDEYYFAIKNGLWRLREEIVEQTKKSDEKTKIKNMFK